MQEKLAAECRAHTASIASLQAELADVEQQRSALAVDLAAECAAHSATIATDNRAELDATQERVVSTQPECEKVSLRVVQVAGPVERKACLQLADRDGEGEAADRGMVDVRGFEGADTHSDLVDEENAGGAQGNGGVGGAREVEGGWKPRAGRTRTAAQAATLGPSVPKRRRARKARDTNMTVVRGPSLWATVLLHAQYSNALRSECSTTSNICMNCPGSCGMLLQGTT
jgi:hypothetical protein